MYLTFKIPVDGVRALSDQVRLREQDHPAVARLADEEDRAAHHALEIARTSVSSARFKPIVRGGEALAEARNSAGSHCEVKTSVVVASIIPRSSVGD